ncbi:UNC-like C-terminal-domain-containing protein [Cercophora newfieldiana]|uniref:UNC-like C-terminal-domain-containing protein n=1 Tax=Cercophora newfieldiana TaxID=92897 RepID=A0AA40CQH4_9PEZI|nr:UNC-like C-terminal-domain-containing protein [Cercophora newfieldiana]
MCRPGLPRRGFAVALAVLGLHTAVSNGSRSAAQDATLSASSAAPEVCESKTINYITHTLPQQCLRTSWSAAPTVAATATPEVTLADGATTTGGGPEPTTLNETQKEQKQPSDQEAEKDKASEEDPDNQGFASGSFMSFEEWKEMMLRKSGQDPAKLKDKKSHEHRGERDPTMASHEPDSIGEDGEIDFDALSEKVSELASSSSGEPTSQPAKEVEEPVLHEDGVTHYYRSKDAGKTCKERFSYSSFDAGATILKTSPGAKNPKAILVENKDTYMLLECRTKNKFVIVELSDDILVDTVVLANFEFFSSMIRQFRVSVSDRYPVKLEKWVDLGTFEARNSRDIQAFLVEHPQIYTKYIRIEFLSHYGNEYYCPVSLLRVHGTRMLDSWKEQSHDDEVDQIEGTRQEPLIESNQTETKVDVAPSNTTEKSSTYTAFVEMGLSPWQPIFYYNFSEETCVLRSPTTEDPTPVSVGGDHNHSAPAGHRESVTVESPQATPVTDGARSAGSSSSAAASAHHVVSPSQQTSTPSAASSGQPQKAAHISSNNNTTNTHSSKHSTARADGSSDSSSSRNSGTSTPSSSTTSRNKTSSSSASSASPTVQESFFKTVTKRLQLLESNTSLSLQYIEEQSRFLQDALLKMEKKQAGRVDAFLDSLNKTVLAELRTVRTQYDQIWQSTVIALETQREQSQREIVALSGRLAVLADEVVFQKRMAILQSVLLLSCLVLVIFSRSGGGSNNNGGSPSRPFDSFSHHFRSDSMSASPAPAGFHSPSSPPVSSSTPQQHTNHARTYRGDKILPMTPTSQTSREGTPLIHVDSVDGPFFGDPSPSPPHQQQQVQRRRSRIVSETAEERIEEGDENSVAGLDASARDDRSYASQGQDSGPVHYDEQDPPMRPLAKVRSSSSQLGSVRKPLPALPEDPS